MPCRLQPPIVVDDTARSVLIGDHTQVGAVDAKVFAAALDLTYQSCASTRFWIALGQDVDADVDRSRCSGVGDFDQQGNGLFVAVPDHTVDAVSGRQFHAGGISPK
jgi:hypothetical protein